MALQYDVAVLGGGPGGYAAAIRASQLGKKVVIVDRDKLGGTCLHRGCIPTKALLRSAEVYHTVKNGKTFGVHAASVSFDYAQARERQAGIVNQLYQGVQYLMRQHKIDCITGSGRIIGPSIFSPRSGSLAVEQADGETITVVSEHLIIATGSRPRQLERLTADGEYILTSDDALQLDTLPDSMIIVGGGVIGVEWASMLHDFGVEVTLVESAVHLLPAEDADTAKELERLFKHRGIRVITGAKVLAESFGTDNGRTFIDIETDEDNFRLSADKLLLSVGREANVDGIGLENTDIRVHRGAIQVNETMQTSEPHIYAVGDVIGGFQLAHVAMAEGVLAAEHAAGQIADVRNLQWIPRCVYSRPEIASIGLTEREAAERGVDLKIGKFPFRVLGKALVHGETDGFVKVIADRQTNDIVGVHMIGPHVTDYISEAALAQLLDATPWEVGRTIHPHPTLAEGIAEAMLSVDGLAIHL